AEHRVTGPGHLGHRRHAEHRAVRVEHAGKVVLLGNPQAQYLLVEHPGLAQVGRGGERDDLTRAEHASPWPRWHRPGRPSSPTSTVWASRKSEIPARPGSVRGRSHRGSAPRWA